MVKATLRLGQPQMTATAILTYLPALDPDVFWRWADEAKAKAEARKTHYRNWAEYYVNTRVHALKQELRPVHSNAALANRLSEQAWIDNACEAERKKAIEHVQGVERGQTLGIESLYSLRMSYLHWQDAEQTAKLARKQAANTKATPAEVRIAVIYSYPIRDTLRADGYKFDPDGHWFDPVGGKTTPAWIKTFAAADRVSVEAAVAKLQGLGVAFRNAATTSPQHWVQQVVCAPKIDPATVDPETGEIK